jgi:hypothetical protein
VFGTNALVAIRPHSRRGTYTNMMLVRNWHQRSPRHYRQQKAPLSTKHKSVGLNERAPLPFGAASFNLLSPGDVESAVISGRLRRDKYPSRETDVSILAHHGADNGFTNKSFLIALVANVVAAGVANLVLMSRRPTPKS